MWTRLSGVWRCESGDGLIRLCREFLFVGRTPARPFTKRRPEGGRHTGLGGCSSHSFTRTSRFVGRPSKAAIFSACLTGWKPVATQDPWTAAFCRTGKSSVCHRFQLSVRVDDGLSCPCSDEPARSIPKQVHRFRYVERSAAKNLAVKHSCQGSLVAKT
jgi:hypothetical protein